LYESWNGSMGMEKKECSGMAYRHIEIHHKYIISAFKYIQIYYAYIQIHHKYIVSTLKYIQIHYEYIQIHSNIL
jgi:hypothetical protein